MSLHDDIAKMPLEALLGMVKEMAMQIGPMELGDAAAASLPGFDPTALKWHVDQDASGFIDSWLNMVMQAPGDQREYVRMMLVRQFQEAVGQ